MYWWIVLLFAVVGYLHRPNWRGFLTGAGAGAVAGLVVFAFLMVKRRKVLAEFEEQERVNREGIQLLMDRRERNVGWSPELERKFQEMMAERRERGLWPHGQEEGGKAQTIEQPGRPGFAMRGIRAVNRVGTWILIVVPVLWSLVGNVREQFGYGIGQPWQPGFDVVFGWGMWLVGVVIWIAIVRGITGWIDRKMA